MDHIRKPTTKAGKILKEFTIIILSAFFSTFVQMFVMIPNGMTSGGTDTLARVLKYKLFNFLRVADIKDVYNN